MGKCGNIHYFFKSKCDSKRNYGVISYHYDFSRLLLLEQHRV